MIKEIQGNLFDSKCQVIVNTVNCKGVMGKGIALEFKYRYPKMYEKYVVDCEKGTIKPGVLTLWKGSRPWILNFPTKLDWKFPSRIGFIEKGLESFVKNYKKWNIKSIAFPKLGTQHGKLDWKDVKRLMYQYLEPLNDLEVYICHFDPNSKDLLFEKLKIMTKSFNLDDYISEITLTKSAANLLYNYLKEKKIKNMVELQKIKGFGEKSIEKVYEFLRNGNKSKQTKLNY